MRISDWSSDVCSSDLLGYRANWLDRLQRAGFPDTEKVWRRYVSNYIGALRMIDDQVARMLDFMGKQGLLDNTIIVRVADHGDYLMEYGLARKGVGLPELLTHIQIGRESCRERVCQYV